MNNIPAFPQYQPAQEPEQGPVFQKLLAYVCNVPDDGIYTGELYQERHSLIAEAVKFLDAKALAQPTQREPLIAFRHGCKWCGELNGCEHKQPAQEPVARLTSAGYIAEEDDDIQVYQRPWVDLTFAEICEAEVIATDNFNNFSELKFARALEAKLKEKNT